MGPYYDWLPAMLGLEDRPAVSHARESGRLRCRVRRLWQSLRFALPALRPSVIRPK